MSLLRPSQNREDLLALLSSGGDMARRCLQQKGDLYVSAGMWMLRWKEKVILSSGDVVKRWTRSIAIGPAIGPMRLTKTQARRIAWENHLSKVDQNNLTPQSIMTVRDFVVRRFIPEHVAMLKPGGRVHYSTQLPIVLDGIPEKKQAQKKWTRDREGNKIPPPEPKRVCGIGNQRLRDTKTEDIQRLVSAALGAGYSVQYAMHIKNTAHAIFDHAEDADMFTGRNPAKRVNLPENVPAPQSALSFDQLRAVLAALDPMTRAMFAAASLTSMNVAEICGLKWKYINLSSEWRTVDGEALAPMTIAVRWQWTLGQLGTVKAQKRRRVVPVADLLAGYLKALPVGLFGGSENFVFTLDGENPVDYRNLFRRRLKPLGAKLGIKLGWHCGRRTFSTLADQVGMSTGERQAIMGHSDAAMTMRYTKTPSEQARTALDAMAKLIQERPN